ncbi:hypothetical protein J4E06_07015 [Muricauda sp. NFXS6]|uniref:hypothetical protein n=1 Tax=Allomuricauda sp. NFXS6 TaxID=2819094 RepID=UPI0032DF1D1D
MRFRITCMLAVLGLTLARAQERVTFELEGKSYSYQYQTVNKQFGICAHQENHSFSCALRALESEEDYERSETVRRFTDDYFAKQTFSVMGRELELSQIKALSNNTSEISILIDSLELQVSTKGLLDRDTKKDTMRIQGEDPGNYFLVDVQGDSTYLVSSMGKTTYFEPFVLEMDTANGTDTEAVNDLLTNAVRQKLKDHAPAILKRAHKKIHEKYREQLADFYAAKIKKSKAYVHLATESMIPMGDTLQAPFVFRYLKQGERFFVEACKESDMGTCPKYGPFRTGIPADEFTRKVYQQHDQFQTGNPLNDQTIRQLYEMLQKELANEQLRDENRELQKELSATVEALENQKTKYSGQLVVQKKFDIRIKDEESLPPKSFIVDFATVHFFNNRANKIAITGHLEGEPDHNRVLINNSWSLSLRDLNYKDQSNQVSSRDRQVFTFLYDDALDYIPYDRHNYAVRNGNVKLVPGDTVKIKERNIGDYFTGVFFSDFLGLNSNNANGFIVAEGRIRVPMNLRSFKKITLLDNISAYVSVNLVGGFEDNSRSVELGEYQQGEQSFETDNFNLLGSNNVDAGLQVTPISFEWKGASTFIHARYGLRFLRTRASYDFLVQSTETDGTPTNTLETADFQIYSIGQEAELNFEIRPQSTIGIDLTVGLNWFGATGTNDNNIDLVTNNNSRNLKVMANLYSLVSPDNSKSGVFVRMGGHYNHGNNRIFPQIMVGYATNLTSFVNKFKKDDNGN